MRPDLSTSSILANTPFLNCAPAIETSTPIEQLVLSGGREIYVKREDKIDDLGCGNKLRKLHYVLHEARAAGIDTLISLGSLPSNQCKAVAKVAKQNGMRAHLVYGGDIQQRPEAAQGNYLLTSLLDPKITWFERTQWTDLESKVQGVYDQEVKAGKTPLIIRSGVSYWPGMIGSIELALETAKQLLDRGEDRVDIVCAAGSGGTAVGFQFVAEVFNLDHVVHGICIGEPSSSLAKKTELLLHEAYNALGLGRHAQRAFYLHDAAIGRAYDQPEDHELAVMREGVSRYGLLLDPNYMLKTFIGLLYLIQHQVLRRDAATIMIHTGGQIGVFDSNTHMKSWHEREYPDWVRAAVKVR